MARTTSRRSSAAAGTVGSTSSTTGRSVTNRVGSGKVAKVSRAQVIAAQGRIITDQRQGKQTPEWVRKVAAAGVSKAS